MLPRSVRGRFISHFTYSTFAEESTSFIGIEMLVMDDGWFGHREDDNSSLGDWQVNEEKLPGGLKTLVESFCQDLRPSRP